MFPLDNSCSFTWGYCLYPNSSTLRTSNTDLLVSLAFCADNELQKGMKKEIMSEYRGNSVVKEYDYVGEQTVLKMK